MAIAVILFTSMVAFFTFGGFSGQSPKQASFDSVVGNYSQWITDEVWLSDKKPQRKAVVQDREGNARRTADGTQMTRRDRGREYWSSNPDLSVDNPRTLKNWLAKKIGTLPGNGGVKTGSGPSYNFSAKRAAPVLSIQPAPAEFQPAGMRTQVFASEAAPSALTVSEAPVQPAPAAVETPVITLNEPVSDAMQTVSAVTAVSSEILDVPPAPLTRVSIGRKIKSALMADPNLTEAARLTLKVYQVNYKITLRGLVSTEKEKAQIGDVARAIAGQAAYIDNEIIVLSA